MSIRGTARRVTASDIARAAGVSRATVGFVLNDTQGQTISAATRERVQAEASRLGYRPSLHARALRSGESRLVVLLLPEYPVEHNLSQMISEAALALDEAGYSLVTSDPHTHRRARPLWEALQPDVVMSLDPLSGEQRRAIEQSGAAVLSAQDLSGPAERVESDVIRGPVVQVEHLLDRGHRRLAFAATAGAGMKDMSDQRAQQARATAVAAGAELISAPVTEDTAPDVVAAWSGAGVTGVAAFNDDVAATVIGAALRSGLSVPGRLAVVGHDDTPLARLVVPRLTTVHVDVSGIGRHFAAVALSVASGTPLPPMPRQVPRAQLVVRESS